MPNFPRPISSANLMSSSTRMYSIYPPTSNALDFWYRSKLPFLRYSWSADSSMSYPTEHDPSFEHTFPLHNAQATIFLSRTNYRFDFLLEVLLWHSTKHLVYLLAIFKNQQRWNRRYAVFHRNHLVFISV